MPEEPIRRLTCQKTSGHCQLYWAGHNTHWIHAKHIGRTPWGWRDAAVTGIDGRWLTVDYVLDSGTLRLWHHTALRAELPVGSPVRVHEQYYVLGSPLGWLNVIIEGGPGPVLKPMVPAPRAGQTTGGVQDLATGRALALDHVDRKRE